MQWHNDLNNIKRDGDMVERLENMRGVSKQVGTNTSMYDLSKKAENIISMTNGLRTTTNDILKCFEITPIQQKTTLYIGEKKVLRFSEIEN